MNEPDPLVLLVYVLVQRHGLSPERAWAMLSRAAERKGMTVYAMVTAIGLQSGRRGVRRRLCQTQCPHPGEKMLTSRPLNDGSRAPRRPGGCGRQ